MIDREKTIRDLENIGAWHTHHYEPFHYECAETIHNALKLLKEQEPRVMTLEEARNAEVVWAEDRSTKEIYPCIVKNNMNDSKLYKYGVQWRCWTSRPRDEQMKAVKWE